jgi:predicted enzyme related to lactoylglutathione lyase
VAFGQQEDSSMARPSHFEIPVDDPDRAEAFYSKVFGWTFQRFEGAPDYYGMANTGDDNPGINGALYKRGETSETVLTMSVDSIEEAIATAEANGATVVLGKTPIPGMGYFANLKDTEGNTIGIFTNDEGTTV